MRRVTCLIRRAILVLIAVVVLLVAFDLYYDSAENRCKRVFAIPYPSGSAVGPIVADAGGSYLNITYHLSPSDFKQFTSKNIDGYEPWRHFDSELTSRSVRVSSYDKPHLLISRSEDGHSHRFIVADADELKIYLVYFGD